MRIRSRSRIAVTGARWPGQLDIAVVRLPRISNYDDFPRARARSRRNRALRRGTRGIARRSRDYSWIQRARSPISDGCETDSPPRSSRAPRAACCGICGGCQMLGESIEDPASVESDETRCPGSVCCRSSHVSRTQAHRASARARQATRFGARMAGGRNPRLRNPHGNVERATGTAAPFRIVARNGARSLPDGAVSRASTSRVPCFTESSRTTRCGRPFSARCAGVKGSPSTVKRGLSPRAKRNTIGSPQRLRMGSICRCSEK